MFEKQQPMSVSRSAVLTVPELEQSKSAVLNTLASAHSRRIYVLPDWIGIEVKLMYDVVVPRGSVRRNTRVASVRAAWG
jgi:hypothetical protein